MPADAAACAAIYAPYVDETVISFESDAPSASEMVERIAAVSATHAWLVAERDERVVGFAYGAPFAERAAYRWTCTVSVYVARDRRRAGTGRALYEALFARLAERGHRVALAGLTLPNPASEGLHRALGFECAGIYRDIGFKHGAWHDVAWFQRALGEGSATPPSSG